MSFLPIEKSVGLALWGREELLGPLAFSEIPNRSSYGSRNNRKERQDFALLAYEPLRLKFSVVNATGLKVMEGVQNTYS